MIQFYCPATVVPCSDDPLSLLDEQLVPVLQNCPASWSGLGLYSLSVQHSGSRPSDHRKFSERLSNQTVGTMSADTVQRVSTVAPCQRIELRMATVAPWHPVSGYNKDVHRGALSADRANDIHRSALSADRANDIHQGALSADSANNIHRGALSADRANDIHRGAPSADRANDIHRGALSADRANNIHRGALSADLRLLLDEGLEGGRLDGGRPHVGQLRVNGGSRVVEGGSLQDYSRRTH